MGFPSPAEDYKEDPIDLSKELVQHPASTFFFRVSGKSMEHTIPDGAILVVDRSIKPCNSSVILVVLDGEFTVRRLVKTSRMTVLHADNPAYKPIPVTEDMNLQVWGVVTAAVIRLNKII
jgi:DNA polymerase V